ncbi:MAG: hypothetical protein M3132_06610 [Actinomycetia bacterium]|nr:hypothetical protein [Actinomycetes bacterium]
MFNRPCIVYAPFTSDIDAARVVAFYNERMRELHKRSVDLSMDEFRAQYDSPTFDVSMFGFEESSSLVALGIAMHWIDGSNGELQYLQLFVSPPQRLRGMGRSLLSKSLGIADGSGRTIITADAVDAVPAGEGFAQSLGADVGMREHLNAVAVEDLDVDMLVRWRREAPERAPEYELMAWNDGWPREYDRDLARLFVIAHEDMPYEEAEFEPVAETAASVRERYERTEGTMFRLTSAVRHLGTGEIVGFSELVTLKSGDPTLHTTLTVVHRDHRGFALGKWIKADAILRGLDRFPGTTHIETENAFSNEPMLAINEEIGFTPEQTSVVYQISTERIRSYLAES